MKLSQLRLLIKEVINEEVEIPTSLKIGRNTIEIETGDYIMYNGAGYQFMRNDKKKYSRWDKNSNNISIPKSAMKQIPFDKMQKKEVDMHGVKCTCWYF